MPTFFPRKNQNYKIGGIDLQQNFQIANFQSKCQDKDYTTDIKNNKLLKSTQIRVLFLKIYQIRGIFIKQIKFVDSQSILFLKTKIILMMKEYTSKQQNIRQKICAKLAKLKEEEQRKSHEEEIQCQMDSYEEYYEDKNFNPHDQALYNLKQAANRFCRYLLDYNNQGDGQYTHKLLFDFFKAQSIFENMEQDKENTDIYQRFIINQMKKQNQTHQKLKKPQSPPTPPNHKVTNQNIYTPSTRQSQAKKMTMKDKLQSGKFCSFDDIPQYGQIQDYRSISSQDQILGQDCLQQLIHKMKKGKGEQEKPRYVRRKSVVDKRCNRTSNNRGRLFKNNAQQQNKMNQIDPQDQKFKYRAKSQSLIRRINYTPILKRNAQKSHRPRRTPVSLSDEQDSSNQTNYDLQQSDNSQNQESSSGQNSEEQQKADLTLAAAEQFKHLDVYQQMQFGDEIDYQNNTAINKGKQKKIHGKEEYHFMKKSQKQKYFKKLTKDYQNRLKKVKQDRRKKPKPQQKVKKPKPKSVSFCDAIRYKVFKSQAKPSDIKIADQKKGVLIKAIWQYDEQ